MGLVLIAEDEAAMLEICADIVEGLGHRTMRAHDGEEALLFARTERPDLVISDHMMPRRTGIQLLHALRADPDLAKVPFLLVSAARPQGREDADAFLAKPVDVDTFEAAVQKMLGTAAPAEAQKAKSPPRGANSANDASRGEMFNWLAHEIKTPLGTARMSAQLLDRKLDAPGSEPERKLSGAIIRQLDRIHGLVNSILDAAGLSEGKIVLHRSRADLSALLREIVADWREFRPLASFVLEENESALELSFDADRVRQVMNNLLANAVKYGGEMPRVHVTVSSGVGQAVVEVEDFGEGIAAAKLPRIFERFHRADSADGRGHGLGLFIASELTRLHGGTLSARSELGKGSTFTLRLPL